MEKNKPVVVGIGELLWDVLPTGKRAGGAQINFVYHATKMGADGYAISAVICRERKSFRNWKRTISPIAWEQ